MQEDINSAVTQADQSAKPAPRQRGYMPGAGWGLPPDKTTTMPDPANPGPPTAGNLPTLYNPAPSGPPVYVPGGAKAPAQPPAIQPPRQPPRQPPQQPPRQPPPPPPTLPSGRPRRVSWWPHALLGIGIALLYVATFLPWAITASGALIMLQSTTIPGLVTQSSSSALDVADGFIGAMLTFSISLAMLNLILRGIGNVMGGGCFAGCAIIPFYPLLLGMLMLLGATILLAAGFGGFGALGQLPLTQSYGLGGLGLAHYELGYYVWYTGLIFSTIGMFGELVVWRR